MEKYVDWATFNKVDNAATIDFLSSLASILAEHGQFSVREIDQLKQVLATRSAGWSQDGKSVVCMLAEDDSESLKAMVLRYGEANFALNHTRFALRPLVLEVQSALSGWAGQCLAKTELVFNRPFFVKSEYGFERRELFSQVLFALASHISDAMSDIKNAADEISTMRPADVLDVTGELERVDAEIASQMGFTGLDPLASFSRGEVRALRKIAIALTDLATGVSDITTQLRSNCMNSETLLESTAYCELLTAEAQRFSGMTLPSSSSTTVWEMRRRAICFSVYKVGLILADLAAITAKAIAPTELKDEARFFSRDVQRRLASQMFAQGIKIELAKDAAAKLVEYCLRHQVGPSEIIEAELKKIHPNLTPPVLKLLDDLASVDISATPGGTVSKLRITEEAKKIRKNVSILTPAAQVMLSLVVMFFLGGCGVKTPIRSDIDDLRPPLPPQTIVAPAEKAALKALAQGLATPPAKP